MTEPSSSHEDLSALRLAAERQDWNGCRAALEKLLLRLPSRRALRLIRDQLMRRLPFFERHQPNVHWPREFIESIDGAASQTERTWPEAEDDFASPGANNFTSAVEALWKASRLTLDEQRCASELVNAFSGAVMAESTEHWGSRHPEQWALWHQLAMEGEGDPRMTDIQLSMRRDPQLKSLEHTAWLEVANQLEAALQEP
jgi:hypothetical protein